MRIKINAEVETDQGKKEVVLDDCYLQQVVEDKAKEMGLKPKQGRLMSWYSPSVFSIEIEE